MSAVKCSLEAPQSLKKHKSARVLATLKRSKDPSFEIFPTEIRLQIYRELLLSDEELYSVEPRQLPLYPAILMCNKRIHDEAAYVLYGENCFAFGLNGVRYLGQWRFNIDPYWEEPVLPSRNYFQLMRKVHLYVILGVNISEQGIGGADDAASSLQKKVHHVAVTLTLNNLSLLKVEIIGDHVSPNMAANLKATIEGLSDAAFFATCKQIEEADENEFCGSEGDEDEYDDARKPEGDEVD